MEQRVKISFRRGASKIPAKGCPNGHEVKLASPPPVEYFRRDGSGCLVAVSFGRDEREEPRPN